MTNLLPISEAAELNPTLPRDLVDQNDREVHFVPMADVSEDGFVSLKGTRRLGELLKGYTYFGNGDVLIAKITPCMENGKAALVSDMPLGVGFGSTEFHVLRAKPGVCPRYLFFMVWNSWFRKHAEMNMTGTAGQKRVPASFFETFKIPLPSMKEQQRIAAILDKADTTRRKRAQATALSKNLIESVFADLFGDTWSNARRWPTGQLQDLCSNIVDCPHSTPLYSDSPTGLYCVRSSDIQEGNIDFGSTLQITADVFEERIRRYRPQQGDVIYTREGGRLGNAAQVPGDKDISLGQRMMLFTAKHGESTNEFIWALLNSPGIRKQVEYLTGGAAAPRINIADIRLFKVVKPPFEIQRSFSQLVARLRRKEALLAESSSCLQQLFDSLASRAFRGELS